MSSPHVDDRCHHGEMGNEWRRQERFPRLRDDPPGPPAPERGVLWWLMVGLLICLVVWFAFWAVIGCSSMSFPIRAISSESGSTRSTHTNFEFLRWRTSSSCVGLDRHGTRRGPCSVGPASPELTGASYQRPPT